ncbi:MAG: hypothetical protein ACE145_16605 [Terriglobia bacterium]
MSKGSFIFFSQSESEAAWPGRASVDTAVRNGLPPIGVEKWEKLWYFTDSISVIGFPTVFPVGSVGIPMRQRGKTMGK